MTYATARRNSRYTAYFWEAAPVAANTLNNVPFEFILKNSNDLLFVKRADTAAFDEYLGPCNNTVASRSFWNIGGTSKLIYVVRHTVLGVFRCRLHSTINWKTKSCHLHLGIKNKILGRLYVYKASLSPPLHLRDLQDLFVTNFIEIP